MRNIAGVCKALGDGTRLEIVQLLRGKELCVCDILEAFSLSQPAISHHLGILRQAGVVLDRKDGKWVFYRLNADVLADLAAFTAGLYTSTDTIETCAPRAAGCLPQPE